MSSIKHHVTGLEYWRSLEQLADAPEVRDAVDKEFPGYEADTIATSSRRGFLKLMGASLALAGIGLSGCRRWPEEHLAPYSSNPRGRIPGIPEQYASMFELGGVASGLLVTSFDGRPIKIEGNPTHPSSWTVKGKIGSADGFAQASILEMYDPQRSAKVVEIKGTTPRDSTWQAFESFAKEQFASMKGNGADFAILSEASSSPSVAEQKKRLLEVYPKAQWFEYEALTQDGVREGSKLAFGKPLRSVLHLDKASTVVLLDADLLGTHPAHVRYAADWSERRRSADPQGETGGQMSRVYVAECGFSITGSVADERCPVDPGRLYPLARALASKLGVSGITADDKLSEMEEKWVASAAADLKQSGTAGLIAVGPAAAPPVHALAHAINQQIGAVGTTVTLIEEADTDRPTHFQAIKDLAQQINDGKIATLLIIGGNPAYDAPTDLNFAKAIAKVPVSIRLGLYEDETSAVCKWHLPRAHYLETWGDAKGWDGTAGIVQPLILPLYGGKSTIEVLALLSGDSMTTGEQIVRRTWSAYLKGDDFDKEFRRLLESGVAEGSAAPSVEAKMVAVSYPSVEPRPTGLYIHFEQDAHAYDGRFANNGWLLETPDPLTKVVWDNAAVMNKKDADALGVTVGDIVEMTVGGPTLQIPVYVLVGQPEGVVGLSLGLGRNAPSLTVGNGIGFNAYALRNSGNPYIASGVTPRKLGDTYELVMTQNHHLIDEIGAAGRDKRIGDKYESGRIIHEATFAAYKADPKAAEGGRTVSLELFNPPNDFNTPHAWGMSIDLNACIGCNACAVACQAENNIPIVGKQQCKKHREMNWIRIDRYFKGAPDDPRPEVVYQPMACQHCENAPCEQVCPVGATMHDSEGLNTMVYNRCIGTRYCSNNCPYKVRRFNYFDYHSQDPRNTGWPWNGIPDTQQMETVNQIKRMVFNPEVTMRMRGVMEKCTYCVQRIHRTTTARRIDGKDVQDGDIITACQQACPTQAIVFGNLNDNDAKVTQLQKNPRAYAVLDSTLDTRPRTRYLAKIRNPAEV